MKSPGLLLGAGAAFEVPAAAKIFVAGLLPAPKLGVAVLAPNGGAVEVAKTGLRVDAVTAPKLHEEVELNMVLLAAIDLSVEPNVEVNLFSGFPKI